MGYSITIGELKVLKSPEDGTDSSCIGFYAKDEKHESAPAFGEPTDYTNSRWPSYSGWHDTLEDAGMYDLFFCGGDLIGGHPGVRLVTEELVNEFKIRKAVFEKKYPNVEATYGKSTMTSIDKENPIENSVYCRIVWLDYWLSWALSNCETPVIENS